MFNNCNKITAFLLANKILIENDLGLIFPVSNKEEDDKYKEILVETYKDDSNKNELFISFLKNNFHNYDLDTIRKETLSECIDINVLKKIYDLSFINFSENNLNNDTFEL